MDFSSLFDSADSADLCLELCTAFGSPPACKLMLHSQLLAGASPYLRARLSPEWQQQRPTPAAPLGALPRATRQTSASAATSRLSRMVKVLLPGGRGNCHVQTLPVAAGSGPGVQCGGTNTSASGLRVLLEHVEAEELQAARAVLYSMYRGPERVAAEADAALLLRMLPLADRLQVQGCVDACFGALGKLTCASFDAAPIGAVVLLYRLPVVLAATAAHRAAIAAAKAGALQSLAGRFSQHQLVSAGECEAFASLPMGAVLSWASAIKQAGRGKGGDHQNLAALAAAWVVGKQGKSCSGAQLRHLECSLGLKPRQLATGNKFPRRTANSGTLLGPRPQTDRYVAALTLHLMGLWTRAAAAGTWLAAHWRPVAGGALLTLIFAAELYLGRGWFCRWFVNGGPAAFCGPHLSVEARLMYILACVAAYPPVLTALNIAALFGAIWAALTTVFFAWIALSPAVVAAALMLFSLWVALLTSGLLVGQGTRFSSALVKGLQQWIPQGCAALYSSLKGEVIIMSSWVVLVACAGGCVLSYTEGVCRWHLVPDFMTLCRVRA